MGTIWIIGAGKFGRNAALKLRAKHPGVCLTVVDQDENKCGLVKIPGIEAVCMDGISFLSDGLAKPVHPEWIVPAIPVHVAWHWIKEQLKKEFEIIPVEIPDKILCLLPNPMKGKGRELYAGLADFICPEDCPEPDKICTVTQKPRPYNLYQRLKDIQVAGFTSIVIQSRGLAPGAGGYGPQALFDALSVIQQTKDRVLLSTACRCHAVLQAFRLVKRGS
jgi:hypothetical protein